MRRWFIGLICLLLLQICQMPQVVHAQDIPDNIYKWVLATPRASYYFNKQQIRFVTDEQGKADTNVLEVPILEQYDWIKKEDVIDKRRWNDLDMAGFGDLWGYAGLVHINIEQQTVTYIAEMYLNSWWTPIWKFDNKTVIDLKKMSDKNVDRIFFEAIIDYAKKNEAQILQQQGAKILPKIEKPVVKKPLTEQQRIKMIIDDYNAQNQNDGIPLKKVVPAQ